VERKFLPEDLVAFLPVRAETTLAESAQPVEPAGPGVLAFLPGIQDVFQEGSDIDHFLFRDVIFSNLILRPYWRLGKIDDESFLRFLKTLPQKRYREKKA
jgi:hypothetical protein